MNKRGQFYIIMAVIISLLVYSLYLPGNEIKQVKLLEDFQDIGVNYQQEAPRVVNNYVYQGMNFEDITDNLATFSTEFLDQAQKKNPDIELAIVYSDGETVFVKSFNKDGTIVQGGEGEFDLRVNGANQGTVSQVTLNISGKEFEHQVPIKVKNFGDQYSEVEFPVRNDVIKLDINGVFHTFDVSQNGPSLGFIIQAKTDREELTVRQVLGEGSQIYQVRF